jgi:glycosyltransferase involved in cell wall biosynthesis
MFDYSKLKFCFLAGTLEHGGAERQLFYVLQALRRAGAVPRLLSLDRGEFWEERIRSLGVPVTCVGDEPSRLRRLLRVFKVLRRDPPAVVQSQHFFANAYAGLVARLVRASGIGAIRNDGRSEIAENGRCGAWLNLRCPGIIAANSQAAIQHAVGNGFPSSRLYFLPNVVDTEHFQPQAEPAQAPVTLLAVGRLVKQKRLDRFISILGRLRTEYHLNVRGLIVGPRSQSEDLRPVLEHQAHQLGLFPSMIEFCGGVSDTRGIYRRAAVCVLTSDHEGTPNVVLEAMACGLPVVASDVGGVTEVVQRGVTGFVLARDNLSGFAAAISHLAKNPGLRAEMGRRAREAVEQTRSLHRLPAYLDGLYQLAFASRDLSVGELAIATMQTETQSPRGV